MDDLLRVGRDENVEDFIDHVRHEEGEQVVFHEVLEQAERDADNDNGQRTTTTTASSSLRAKRSTS